MAVLPGLIPVFLLLALGVLARRWRLLDATSANGLNRLVANLALPALFLAKVGTSPLEASLSPTLVVVTVGLTVATGFFGLWVARLMTLPRPQQGVLAQAALRGNIAYVAFPLILSLHGDAGLRLAAVTAALLIPAMNLQCVLLLESARLNKAGTWRMLVKVLANPMVASALLGLLLAALKWQPWGWLGLTLKTLADFALPGALLALGAQLEIGQWRAVWRPAAFATALKMIALPAMGLLGLHLLGVPPLELSVGVLLLAAPTAVASYSVAADLDGDLDLAGACVLLTTVVSPIGYVAWKLAASAL
jgi:malate permease and related proteins